MVYGSTPSGIAASITAAREGADVVLVEPSRHIGGLSTSGLTTAETEHMLPWTLRPNGPGDRVGLARAFSLTSNTRSEFS